MLKSFTGLLGALLLASSPALAAPTPLVQSLEQLSQSGNGEADYHLGMIYHLGLEGVAQDAQRAYRHFIRSAAAGDPLGAYKLGCFFAGQGGASVPSDPELALRNKLAAAEAGYHLAQADVAQIYFERGEIDEAIRWLEAAARQGNPQAMAGLTMFYSPSGPRPNGARAWLFRELMKRHMVELLDSLPPEQRPAEGEFDAVLSGMFSLQPSQSEQEEGTALANAWTEQRSAVSLRADRGLAAAGALIEAPR